MYVQHKDGEEHMIFKCSRFVNFYTKLQSTFIDVEYFVHH